VFLAEVLVLLAALVVLIKIAFSPTATPKIITLCTPFSVEKKKLTCEEAVRKSTEDTKGQVTKITIGRTDPTMIKLKIPVDPQKEMWNIDIKLDKAFTLPNGKEVTSLRIQIPTDGTDALYRMPNQI
jgi:hypothetical protein